MATTTPSSRTIGVPAPMPSKACTDPNCPFHGTLRVHGRTFTGVVTSAKASKTVTVEFSWKRPIPKYERTQMRRTTIKAHSPPCLDPKEGMVVTVMETRPLSKTKNFVVIKINDASAHTAALEQAAQAKAARANRQELAARSERKTKTATA